jgi:hypothetical protein
MDRHVTQESPGKRTKHPELRCNRREVAIEVSAAEASVAVIIRQLRLLLMFELHWLLMFEPFGGCGTWGKTTCSFRGRRACMGNRCECRELTQLDLYMIGTETITTEQVSK